MWVIGTYVRKLELVPFLKGAHVPTFFIHITALKECMRKFLHSNIERSSRSQEEPNVVLKKNGNKIR